MIRPLLLALGMGAALASCHILGGFEELEARDDGGPGVTCTTVDDCPGASTVCAEWTCSEGRCRSQWIADGSPCLDSSCQSGICVGYRSCSEQEDCLPESMVCDLSLGLCVPCSEELCASAFPGTSCVEGICACPPGELFCRGHGCVAPLSFDSDCDPCQLRCPGAGCVDPYGSTLHCGGCGVVCGFGDCLHGSCQCDQEVCDELRPGTHCLDGSCQCDQGRTWCPGHGCVSPLPFDEFCADCQIHCGLDGCVDPYSSDEHCGGCDIACAPGSCIEGKCGSFGSSEP